MTTPDEEMTCPWLVRIASSNPEPGCEADMWREVECGGVVTIEPGDSGAFHCSNGHRYAGLEAELGPGGLEWQREQQERHDGGW